MDEYKHSRLYTLKFACMRRDLSSGTSCLCIGLSPTFETQAAASFEVFVNINQSAGSHVSKCTQLCKSYKSHTLHYGFQLMHVLLVGVRWPSINNRHVVE